jgi:hypothetical protein
MKKIILHKTIAAFLMSVFIMGLFPITVFAETFPPPSPLGEIKGFNKPVFDTHFSRADRELDPDHWLTQAKWGVTQAIYAWEIIAFGLYENPFAFEEAKNQLEKWSNDELEARFSRWLAARFFGESKESALSEISAMFSETQKNYTWRLDDEGNIIFDGKTGDPLVIRPGEEGREFPQDLLKWRNDSKNLVTKSGASFDAAMINLYPELLAYIPAELREKMIPVIYESGTGVNGLLKREFENIAAREERIFTSLRTRDIWSLRKKSEDEAAEIFTKKLISETEETCSKGIEELNAKIEEASAGTGSLVLLGEEWLQMYKEQFDRGLKAWEEAEERFFIRRIEWEQDSFRLFSEGEEIWLAAFRQFDEERQRWELKAKELFESGEKIFINISENFEKSITEAKAEFELNMTMRIGAGTAKVKALIDMYLICSSAAISAKENIQFWQDQCETNKDPTESDFLDWLSEERLKIWKQAELFIKNKPPLTNKFFLNLQKRHEEEQRILAQIEEDNRILSQIQDIIAGKMTLDQEIAFANTIKRTNYLNNKNFESILEMGKSYTLYTSYIEKAADTRERIIADYAELIGTGALKDILADDASSEDFCLDEYQIALIRAKALVLYWERKTKISNAVLTYAKEINAGRMTEAEGLRAWEDAKNAYNKSLEVYETELKKLNNIGVNIQDQQLILDKLSQELQVEEEKLNKLNSEYSSVIAASIINIESIALKDLNTRIDYLVEEYQKFNKTGNNALYKDVLEYGMTLGIYLHKEEAKKTLNILINGNDEEILSLENLEQKVLEGTASEIDLKLRLAAIDLFADISDKQLRPGDSTYSGADWYFRAKDITPTNEEKAALYGEKLNAQLTMDYKNSSQLLLKKRIDFELEALSNFLKEKPGAKTFEYDLSEFCIINTETAVYVFNILSELDKRILSGKGIFTEKEIENEIISFFITGESFFTGSEQYLTEYFDKYFFSAGLLNLYNEYAAISSFTQKENWQITRNSLSALFSAYNIMPAETFIPDIQEIFTAIYNKSGDFTENTALFLIDFENCFTKIPYWLENEIYRWKTSVIEYFAANIFYLNIETRKNLNVIAFELENLNTKYEKLVNDMESITFIDTQTAEILGNTYTEINNDKLLLIYMQQISLWLEYYNSNVLADENEKHWRQYLTIDPENPKPLPTIVSSLREGIAEDALFNAVYFTNRINDSLSLFSQEDFIIKEGSAKLFNSLYNDKYSSIERSFNSLKYYYNETAHLGRAYDLSKLTIEDAKAQLEPLYDKVKAQEEIFNEKRNAYLKEAEKFLKTGIQYDEQYSVLKKSYNDTDIKRFEYEKQDAIRRWASTAYLNTGAIDYDNCKNKLEKAQIVLSVLSDIYNGEDRRAYENSEYNLLYLEYKQSFTKKLNVLQAINAVASETEKEYAKNDALFKHYKDSLHKLESIEKEYLESTLPPEIHGRILVKDGRLAFSYDDSMKLQGINEANASRTRTFFETKVTQGYELQEIATLEGTFLEETYFENSLRGLSQRMSGYFTDIAKYEQWSYARDYFLLSLINANDDIKLLNNNYVGLGEVGENGSIGRMTIQTGTGLFYNTYLLYKRYTPQLEYSEEGKPVWIESEFIVSANEKMSAAWNGLSPEEKADLEYYIILTLLGINNENIRGFSLAYTRDAYTYTYDYVKEKYFYAKGQAEHWYTFGVYNGMRDKNGAVYERLGRALDQTEIDIDNWITVLDETISSINKNAVLYKASLNKIAVLEGKKEDGQYIEWGDINKTLLETKKIGNEDISMLKTYWEAMQAEFNMKYNSVTEALSNMLRWTRDTENESRSRLETQWIIDINNQQNAETLYHLAEEAFIAGTIDETALKNAAEKAYGKNAASWKNHLDNINTVLINDLSQYLTLENNYYTEFSNLGNEITSITSKTLNIRFLSEFDAREIEWNLMRKDLLEKYKEWRTSADQILENGRADWNTSIQKMEEACKQWYINFQNEYSRVCNEWNEAYLAGLEDKEKWLEQAADAVNQASTESLLSLVGTEGERLARFMDTREPFGIRDAVPKAEILMAELLQSSGINNLVSAFGSLNSSFSNIISPLVRRGMGGISIWDTAIVKTAAADLARKTNAELADREARRLARSANLAADEAINNLKESVNTANKNFSENMDNAFIIKGLWRKNGNNYVKEIIKGSTLFTSIITETVTVPSYKDYVMEPIILQTNMNEKNLEGLDTIIIRAMLDCLYKEVEDIFNDIFGVNQEATVIKLLEVKKKRDYDENRNIIYIEETVEHEEREQSPGKFGAHLGYIPAVKDNKNMGKTKGSIFYDEGGGEIGRLVTELTYWGIIDSSGISEVGMAFWDKRIWNDEDTKIKSPTIRSINRIAGAIAATIISVVAAPFTGGASIGGAIALAVLIAGINSTSDFIFDMLDAAFGYKTIGEAVFDWTKTSAINISTSMISGAFNGFGSVTNEFTQSGIIGLATKGMSATGKVITQTVMSGIQTFTTGFVTSAIEGITYNRDGWGYSTQAFSSGINGTITNVMTSMGSTFTSSGLSAINSGTSLEKLMGFNKNNISNLSKLNSFIGSLVGQGLNYAMGGDFTLNVLNLGLFTNNENSENNYNHGLLELHLSREGLSMNLGSGGANVSIDNLIAVYRGACVWNVNTKIFKYGKENNFKALISLRAQYGYGDDVQRNQLWDILNGNTIINTEAEGNYFGETIINKDGKRVINLGGYKNEMSEEDQFLLAVILGHEAYRDGIVTNDNYLETREAVLAHTKMAIRMINDNQNLAYDYNLICDIFAYEQGMDFFNNYVDNYYDSTADYWRVIMNTDGNVNKVLWDGDYHNVTILDADGKERTVPLQTGSLSAALTLAVFNDINKKDQMIDTMFASGLAYNDETKLWFAEKESAVYIPTIHPTEIQKKDLNSLEKLINSLENIINTTLDKITNGIDNYLNFLKDLFFKEKNNLPNPDIELPKNKENVFIGNINSIQENGNDVLFYMPDNENSVIAGLRGQKDPAFKYIPNLQKWGCNFLSTLAYVQMVVGKNLTTNQIMDIWAEAVKNPNILHEDGYVENPNLLSTMALEKLGRTDIGLSFGEKKQDTNSILIGYKIVVPYGKDGKHFITGDLSKKAIWNSVNLTGNHIDYREVYVYTRK